MDIKFADKKNVVSLISSLGKDFAVLKNPDYVFPEYEICPLSPQTELPLKDLAAIVMDMDGTTTTTETLCLHSLEYMVRCITGRMSQDKWQGLDAIIDYPHIIGNSTTRHVEYLVRTYQTCIIGENLERSFLSAALWTLIFGRDQRRIAEVRNNLIHFGYAAVLSDPEIVHTMPEEDYPMEKLAHIAAKYIKPGAHRKFSQMVRMAIDIYYQRYHEILAKLDAGDSERLSLELLGDAKQQLIEPMPGVAFLLALVKGWLGDEIESLLPEIHGQKTNRQTINKLRNLSKRFNISPVKIGVVTSSIHYEADIVLRQVFRVLCARIEKWPISQAKVKDLLARFSDYRNLYDGFITASDSSEIRLKPHRDLYSIALHQLGINKEDFANVIGFEDSESGTIAIRTAGIGVCIAVPFSETSQHDFRAASHVLTGGIPEALLDHNLFLAG